MDRIIAVLSLLAGGALSGCTAPADARRDDFVSVTLSASRINAGETGRAMLIPLGDRTQVTIIVSGVPPDVSSRPVHLYTFVYKGSCGSLAPQPSYALTDQVLAGSPNSAASAPVRGPFSITNVAPVPIDTLRKDGYAIRVMTSPADGNREIFCGDIQNGSTQGRSSISQVHALRGCSSTCR